MLLRIVLRICYIALPFASPTNVDQPTGAIHSMSTPVILQLQFASAASAMQFLNDFAEYELHGVIPEAPPAPAGKPGRKPKAPVDELGNPEGTKYLQNLEVEGVFKLLPGDPEPAGVKTKPISPAEFKAIGEKIAANAAAAASTASASASNAASASTPSAALDLGVPVHDTTSEGHAQGQQPGGYAPVGWVFYRHHIVPII